MDAHFKFLCVVLCVFSVAACANDNLVSECRYKFTDDEMVEKFRMVMSHSPSDREIFTLANGKFAVKRLNCNYYVTFNLVPMQIDGRALLIFDNAGELISSNVR